MSGLNKFRVKRGGGLAHTQPSDTEWWPLKSSWLDTPRPTTTAFPHPCEHVVNGEFDGTSNADGRDPAPDGPFPLEHAICNIVGCRATGKVPKVLEEDRRDDLHIAHGRLGEKVYQSLEKVR